MQRYWFCIQTVPQETKQTKRTIFFKVFLVHIFRPEQKRGDQFHVQTLSWTSVEFLAVFCSLMLSSRRVALGVRYVYLPAGPPIPAAHWELIVRQLGETLEPPLSKAKDHSEEPVIKWGVSP